MDHAVALVQAYLQLNGYFTSAEYPVMESSSGGTFRTLTDIDILAFRFPAVPAQLRQGKKVQRPVLDHDIDPGLGVPRDRIDMMVGEVKEGKVGINSGARDPAVLKTVMERFGYIGMEADALVAGLLERGAVVTPNGYQARLVAFGAFPPGSEVPPCRIVSLGHVLQYLQRYVRNHWTMLRQCQFKDPAFGFLMTLEKARRGGAGRRGRHGVEIVTPGNGGGGAVPGDRRGTGRRAR